MLVSITRDNPSFSNSKHGSSANATLESASPAQQPVHHQIHAHSGSVRPCDAPLHETIATLFEMLRKELQSYRKHREFAAAYSIVHTRKSGLQEEDDDVYAIADGEPDAIAKYLIPVARLDPSKTIAYYFGNGVPPGAVTVVLTLPDEPLPWEKQCKSIASVEFLPERRDGMSSSSTPTTISAQPDETTTTERSSCECVVLVVGGAVLLECRGPSRQADK